MELLTQTRPGNFDYGEPLGAEERAKTWPNARPDVILWRGVNQRGKEEFSLLGSISYRADIDERGPITITVPDKFADFTTDLTSVPAWFTWLVPKSGAHLPAALIHDGLVHPASRPRTYRTDPPDQVIDRIDADLVFRDAMRDAHVGLIRRWIVWTAVSISSLFVGARVNWAGWRQWYFRALIVMQFGLIAYLGTSATADLFDRDIVGLWNLPWMHGSVAAELAGGLAGAVVVPCLLAALWGRYWQAGLIGGLSVATLLHVTVAIGAIGLAYQGLEWLTARAAWLTALVAVLAVVAAVVVFVAAVT